MTERSLPCLQVIRRQDLVNSVDWSPDGTRLAVGYRESGFEVMTPEGRTLWGIEDLPRFSTLKWSHDGARLASGHAGEVVLCEAVSGDRLWSQEILGSGNSLSWCADGSAFVCSGMRMYVLDAQSGEVLLDLDWPTNAVGWSPAKDRIAVQYGGRLRLLEARSGERVEAPQPKLARLGGLAWSPSGGLLAGLGTDGEIVVWDTSTWQETQRLKGSVESPRDFRWSRDGRFFASGSNGGEVRIWGVESGESVLLTAHEAGVQSVAFSPDGARLASASGDKTLRIWDLSRMARLTSRRSLGGALERYVERQAATVGRRPVAAVVDRWVPEIREYGGTGTPFNGVVVCHDGETMIEGKRHGVRRVDLTSGEVLWESEGVVSGSLDFALSKDGRRVVSSNAIGTARIWEVETGKILSSLSVGDHSSTSRFSPRGNRVATSTDRSGVKIWDAATGEVLLSLEASRWFVDWHPTEDLVLLKDPDRELCVRSASSGQVLHWFGSGDEQVLTAAWSPDGDAVCSASGNTIRLFKTGQHRPLLEWTGHLKNIRCLSWSACGRFVASGARDSTVRIWNRDDGTEAAGFDFAEEYSWRLSWAPSGAFLAASLHGDVTRIFDTSDLVPRSDDRSNEAHSIAPPSSELLALSGALSTLTRQGVSAPLSTLGSLSSLWTSKLEVVGPIAALSQHPNVTRLVSLRWPAATRPGLLSLLLHSAPGLQGWEPPVGVTAEQLRESLLAALSGEEIPANAPPLPVAGLIEAAESLDDRVFNLLEMVGPEAVATDPGLPLRLLAQARRFPPIELDRRRLLGLKLHLDQGGASQGSGQGSERTGIELTGDLRSLLPSQLALPEPVLRAQHLRGELLHRARAGQEPPRLRPTVLVLDVSPPTFGPVESITRLAAHAVASSLLDEGVPVTLVTAGGRGTLRVLERREDLVEIWTSRSQEEADPERALATARAMSETLRGGALEPIVLVLSQVFFGFGYGGPTMPGVRGLFATYSGVSSRPPFASSCERWTSLSVGSSAELSHRLGELVA